MITESWQSYGGVKGIGRFCVTDSRNKTKQGQVMLMYQLRPLPREFSLPMWRPRCLCQQRILPHTTRAHHRDIMLFREEEYRDGTDPEGHKLK